MESDVRSVAAACLVYPEWTMLDFSTHVIASIAATYVLSCFTQSTVTHGSKMCPTARRSRASEVDPFPLGVFLLRRVGFFLPGASTLQSRHRFLAVALQ